MKPLKIAKDAVLMDIINLSSGTLSTLTGEKNYAKLDEIHENLIEFYQNSKKKYKNWREVWDDFDKGGSTSAKTSESAPSRMSDDEMFKVYNSLKKGQTVELWYDSTIKKGESWVPFTVGRKTFSKKYNVGKITLTLEGSRGKYFLYERQGEISFAIGDLATSLIAMRVASAKNSSGNLSTTAATKEQVQEIRVLMKQELGYKANQVSVRAKGSAIYFTIRDPKVDIHKLHDFSRNFEEYQLDERTYEILQGGNTFTFIYVLPKVHQAWGKKYFSQVKDAWEELKEIPVDSNEGVSIEKTKATLFRENEYKVNLFLGSMFSGGFSITRDENQFITDISAKIFLDGFGQYQVH